MQQIAISSDDAANLCNLKSLSRFIKLNIKSQISKIKGEMVLTDFDLATGYVQRKQNVRKREIDLNTFSHILARGGWWVSYVGI